MKYTAARVLVVTLLSGPLTAESQRPANMFPIGILAQFGPNAPESARLTSGSPRSHRDLPRRPGAEPRSNISSARDIETTVTHSELGTELTERGGATSARTEKGFGLIPSGDQCSCSMNGRIENAPGPLLTCRVPWAPAASRTVPDGLRSPSARGSALTARRQRHIGISRNAVIPYGGGHLRFRAGTLERIAQLGGVSVNRLLRGDQCRPEGTVTPPDHGLYSQGDGAIRL
jgi:hypothetical protein